MSWVLLEIFVPLLIALALGVFVGWLLFRWRRRLLHASEWNRLTANMQDAEAEAASTRAAYEETKNERAMLATRLDVATTELDSAKNRLNELESAAAHKNDDLRRAREERDAVRSQLDALQVELEMTNAELTASLAAATSTTSDGRVAELESSLAALRTELDGSQSLVADLDTRLLTAHADDTRLLTAHADIDAAHERIHALEADLRVARAKNSSSVDRGDTAAPSPLAFVAASPTNPAAPPTPLGMAAADHIDDLKVIRGIGPRMESLLNGFGITSWEHLAALDETEVAAVDDALDEFPGRITRDRWVAQAQELVRTFPDRSTRPSRTASRP